MPDEPTASTLAALRGVSSDTITTLLIKKAGMRTRAIRGVRPVNPATCRFVGPAYTVRYVPVREDLAEASSMTNRGNPVYGTFDAIPPGSVVVIDMHGDTTSGALGDILVARLVAIGVAGVVADGGMRDIAPVRDMALPVWCGGFAPPPSGRSLMAVQVQVRIGCGGVLVDPGDIVVADPSGVAVIPRHLATGIAEAGVEMEAVEAWIRREVDRGHPVHEFYPATEKTMEGYRAWVAAGRPE